MAHVTLTPYVLTEPNGADPRIAIPVFTPAAFVLVETRVRGVYVVKAKDRNGVSIAIRTAQAYARRYPAVLERLYDRIGAIGDRD